MGSVPYQDDVIVKPTVDHSIVETGPFVLDFTALNTVRDEKANSLCLCTSHDPYAVLGKMNRTILHQAIPSSAMIQLV
jgi:hypothetical protein